VLVGATQLDLACLTRTSPLSMFCTDLRPMRATTHLIDSTAPNLKRPWLARAAADPAQHLHDPRHACGQQADVPLVAHLPVM
jgi:hypothetical protein